GLALVHGDVGVEHDGDQLVGGTPGHLAGPAVVDRQPDLVHYVPLDRQRPDAWRDHRSGLDLAAGAADHDPVAVADAALGRELRTHLHEHRRLQLVEPAV